MNLEPLFAAVRELSFLNEAGQPVSCNSVGGQVTFCPQELYMFTCATEGSILRWDGLNNGELVSDIQGEFGISNALNSSITSPTGNFIFILTSTSGDSVTSIANIFTQNSLTVEGNGLKCTDIGSGNSETCTFSISKLRQKVHVTWGMG